jgi:hypothetical protein
MAPSLLRALAALALCALFAPAASAAAAGSSSAISSQAPPPPKCKRGEVTTCKGTVCCPGLTCGFTSTGGGFYCL